MTLKTKILVITLLVGFLLLRRMVIIVIHNNSTTDKIVVQTATEETVETISKCEELIAEHANTNIDIYDGEIAEVNFDSYPGSSMFKSRTSDVVSEGPNFAGHFALATWGCGTSCFGFSLVDIKTGEIINFEPVHENFHLREFSVNQNYIVIDPVYAGRERSYYLLLENDGKYTFEKTCTEISDEDLFP